MTSVTALDYILLSAVVLSIFIGFVRGFVREVLGCVAWSLSFWIALTQAHHLEPFFQELLHHTTMAHFAAMGSVGLLSLVVLLILTQWLSYGTQKSIMQSVNRSLGMLFGLVRAFVMIVGMYFCVLFVIPVTQQPSALHQCKSIVWLNTISVYLWRNGINDGLQRYVATIKPARLKILYDNMQLLEKNPYMNLENDRRSVEENHMVQQEILPNATSTSQNIRGISFKNALKGV